MVRLDTSVAWTTAVVICWMNNPSNAFTTRSNSRQTFHVAKRRATKLLTWGAEDGSSRLMVSQKQMSTDGDSSSTSSTPADEEEFHPTDPAETTTQFLSGLWSLIAQGNTLVRGVS